MRIFIILFSALQFLACKMLQSNAEFVSPSGFDWQGHRGSRGLIPENTVISFLHAMTFPGVTTLELDLAVSKDMQLIVSHEPWFNPSICRLPNGDSIPKSAAVQYLIYALEAHEIQGFDCGSMGNPRFPQQQKQAAHKPTFSEVVLAVQKNYPNRKINWNIEIKSNPDWDGTKTPPIEEFARLVMKQVKALGIENNCNIQSFDVRPLQIIKREAPQLKLALLIENLDGLDKNLEKLGFTPDYYSPYYMTVTKGLVRNCHKKGMKIIPWTVNDKASMKSLIKKGVDGIITDYPNLIPTPSNKPKH